MPIPTRIPERTTPTKPDTPTTPERTIPKRNPGVTPQETPKETPTVPNAPCQPSRKGTDGRDILNLHNKKID